jgi:hypothetical protein
MKRLVCLLTGALFAAACGNSTSAPDAFQSAVPTSEALTMEVSGAGSENAASDSASVQVQADALGGSGLEFLPAIRNAIAGLNQGMKDAFGPVEKAVVTEGRTQANGEVKVYGPFTGSGGFQYLLTVARLSETHFAWKLQVGPPGSTPDAGSTAGFVTFAAGTTFRAASDLPHRGRGTIGVDLDAYKTVNTGFPGQGKLFVAFSHHGPASAADGGSSANRSRTLVYVLKNFSADLTKWQAVDAVFYAHKNGITGVTTVRVVSFADIPSIPNDTAAKELLIGRARYNPGVGGRAEVAVTGGDLDGSVFFGIECWEKAENLVFKATAVCSPGEMPGSGSCTWTAAGNESACAVKLIDGESEVVTPADQNKMTLEPDAPATDLPAVPGSMPNEI